MFTVKLMTDKYNQHIQGGVETMHVKLLDELKSLGYLCVLTYFICMTL